MNVVETLGERLKFAREQAKLTQTQLAARSGVAQSDISKLERGDMAKSTGLPALARALRCDIDWLDTGEGDPDFGHKRRGWPFPSIDRSRFESLSDEQRAEIQGAVRKLLLDYERDAHVDIRQTSPAQNTDQSQFEPGYGGAAGKGGSTGLTSVKLGRKWVGKSVFDVPAQGGEKTREQGSTNRKDSGKGNA